MEHVENCKHLEQIYVYTDRNLDADTDSKVETRQSKWNI